MKYLKRLNSRYPKRCLTRASLFIGESACLQSQFENQVPRANNTYAYTLRGNWYGSASSVLARNRLRMGGFVVGALSICDYLWAYYVLVQLLLV